jgi:hypothetical protein
MIISWQLAAAQWKQTDFLARSTAYTSVIQIASAAWMLFPVIERYVAYCWRPNEVKPLPTILASE